MPLKFLFFSSIFLLGLSCTSTTMDIPETGDSDQVASDKIAEADTSTSSGFIDMHVHIYPTTEEVNAAYVDDLVATAKTHGVSKIVLGLNARHEPERPPTYSPEHDEWVLETAERYPNLIIPALNGFDPADATAVTYIKDQLATGKWKLIGELDLRNKPKKTTTPANSQTMMAIYALAGQYGVPVMIHFDVDYGTDAASGRAELKQAIAENPNTNFIIAHNCGRDEATLMAAYDNVYCEQEFAPIASGIDPDRVVLGTDMQVHGGRSTAAKEDYLLLIDRLREAISGWSEEDRLKASIETPTALLKL